MIFVKLSPDYTLEQVSLLTARCRHLEGQLEDATRKPSPASATEHLAPLLPDNTHLQKQGPTEGILHGGSRATL
ncbi:hypothetical protein EYF80_067335 [Liparis tanakae]|uniref:Uncharacterized protein n=1 Tax=Liparis tanakae TaxID=230148 RepID=A0A4Z2E1B2_9TELE|nr:hypothetical protein EYF80_067335 [Liparis tanakae]